MLQRPFLAGQLIDLLLQLVGDVLLPRHLSPSEFGKGWFKIHTLQDKPPEASERYMTGHQRNTCPSHSVCWLLEDKVVLLCMLPLQD